MSKRNSVIMKVSKLLLAAAPTLLLAGTVSFGYFGEPKAPKKIKRVIE